MISEKDIVKNLTSSEAVIINNIKKLGEMYSIKFTGVNTNKSSSKVISEDEFCALQTLTSEGSFNFTGDPQKFVLFAEAERINSAYQFDPLFAINCSIVDPLPHQVEAVYKFLLPQPKIRFLLADDTGAGKTIMTEHWTNLFSGFIVPLKNNGLEIEVSFKAKTNDISPLDESSQIYKIVKETAKQLGLDLEEE